MQVVCIVTVLCVVDVMARAGDSELIFLIEPWEATFLYSLHSGETLHDRANQGYAAAVGESHSTLELSHLEHHSTGPFAPLTVPKRDILTNGYEQNTRLQTFQVQGSASEWR